MSGFGIFVGPAAIKSATESVLRGNALRVSLEPVSNRCQKIKATVLPSQWQILRSLLLLTICDGDTDWDEETCTVRGSVPLADLLLELGRPEAVIYSDLEHLQRLRYVERLDDEIALAGHVMKLQEIALKIMQNFIAGDGDKQAVKSLVKTLIPK